MTFFFVAVLALHPHEDMHTWDDTAPHFFKMPVLMLILITVLNDGTLCTIAYDHVIPSHEPEKWNLKVLWLVSFQLAMVAMASSLLLLWACLTSGLPNSLFSKMGLPLMYFDQVITTMYLKVSWLAGWCTDSIIRLTDRSSKFFYKRVMLLSGCMCWGISCN